MASAFLRMAASLLISYCLAVAPDGGQSTAQPAEACSYAACMSLHGGSPGSTLKGGAPRGSFMDFPEARSVGECCWMCGSSRECGAWEWLPHLATKCHLEMNDPDTKDIGTNAGDQGQPFIIGGRCTVGTGLDIIDPHFIGARGTPFNFHSQPGNTLCLFTDAHLHINAKLIGYNVPSRTFSTDSAGLPKQVQAGAAVADTNLSTESPVQEEYEDYGEGYGSHRARAVERWQRVQTPPTTWIGEVGILWLGEGEEHTLRMVVRDSRDQKRGHGFLGKVEVDGKVLPRLRVKETFLMGPGAVLEFSEVKGEETGSVEVYTVKIGELLEANFQLRAADVLLQAPGDAEVHINIGISKFKASDAVHGILGQTFHIRHALKAEQFKELAEILRQPIDADGPTGEGFLDGKPEDYICPDILSSLCTVSAYKKPITTWVALQPSADVPLVREKSLAVHEM